MKSTYALLVTGLAAQQAAATWNFFDNFGTPDYSNNVCDDKQKGGFNWADLTDGQSVGNYGDFDFSGGWKCSNSFGKRDSLSKRTFGNKCIKNTVRKNKPAAFGCAQRGFSITHMDVSAEFDAELELHYKMGDGSICKQHSSCSAGGSTLQNTQCGGAKSVEVYLGSHYKGDKESCEIGFHNIGFDCDAEKPYTPPSPPSPPSPPEVPASSSEGQSSTIAIESSSAPASSAVSSAVETTAYSAIETTVVSSAVETPASSSAVETPATSANGCGQYGGEGCNTPTETPASSGVPYTNSSMPAYTPPASSAVEISSYVASVPSISTATPQPESSTVAVPPTSESSAAAGCGYGESCEQTSTVVASSAVSSAVVTSTVPATSSAAPQPSSPSYPPVDITDSVPKCMNSWLQISAPDCKDNTDSSCYCLKPEFTKNVIDCISARCGSDDEISKGLQYFIGICAEHVPKNPSIVGDCPSYIPLNPTPAAPPAGGESPAAPPAGGESSAAPSAPASSAYGPGYPGETPAASTTTAAGETPVITTAVSSATMTEVVGTTTAAGETPAGETPCTTITFGTTTLTVPQVHFTTQPSSAGANPTEPVALVPGTAEPAQTPAATTPAGGAPYPIPSTMGTATVPMGTATGTGGIRPSSPAEFTGAASPFNIVPKGALFGAALAFFAL
jgi:hypothetical protein